MIVIFNLPGLVMIAIAIGVAYLASGRFDSEGPLMLVAGLLMLPMDLYYRLKQWDRPLFHPSRGGSIFFIPVWIIGAVSSLVGLVNILRSIT